MAKNSSLELSSAIASEYNWNADKVKHVLEYFKKRFMLDLRYLYSLFVTFINKCFVCFPIMNNECILEFPVCYFQSILENSRFRYGYGIKFTLELTKNTANISINMVIIEKVYITKNKYF